MRFLTAFSSLLPFVLITSPSASFAANVFDKATKGASPKRDVTLTLSSPKTAYAADEPVQIEVTLKNSDDSKPARILDWVVPCQTAEAAAAAKEDDLPAEMSFFDIKSHSQQTATYLGAVFKRVEPDPNSNKDYRMLMPGEEISCTIDLGDYYKFDATGDDAEYTIEYSVENFQLSPGNSGNAPGQQKQQLESLQSNTLTLKIDPRPSPSTEGRNLGGLRGLQSGSTTFTSCDAQQSSDLVAARSHALTASREALTVLSAVGSAQSTSSCPRYQTWFNTYNSGRHNELAGGYNLIVDKLENAQVTFDCKCKQ
jgi:peptidyl-Lys metalloendopeptidase